MTTTVTYACISLVLLTGWVGVGPGRGVRFLVLEHRGQRPEWTS